MGTPLQTTEGLDSTSLSSCLARPHLDLHEEYLDKDDKVVAAEVAMCLSNNSGEVREFGGCLSDSALTITSTPEIQEFRDLLKTIADDLDKRLSVFSCSYPSSFQHPCAAA